MPLLIDNTAIFTPWRCGSVSTRQAVLDAGGHAIKGHHGRPHEHPELMAEHSAVGLIRDPWSWYASLYHFALARQRVGDIQAYTGGPVEFKPWIYSVTHPRERRIPATTGMVFWCGTAGQLAASGLGLASFAFRWFYSTPCQSYITTDDLDTGLAALGITPGERLNASQRPSLDELYNDDMRRWVEEADAAALGELVGRSAW